MAISSILHALEPRGKVERRRFPATFAHRSSLLTGRCFPMDPTIKFIVCVRLFSFTPRFTTDASPGLLIGDLDCNSDVHLPKPTRSSVSYWHPRWKGTKAFITAVPLWRPFQMLSWPC